jgi:hypothetical protein
MIRSWNWNCRLDLSFRFPGSIIKGHDLGSIYMPTARDLECINSLSLQRMRRSKSVIIAIKHVRC